MKVKILRHYCNMSQSQFASKFNIPLSTYQDWEQERRNPPQYLLDMIEKILTYENLFDPIDYQKQCKQRRLTVEGIIKLCKTAGDGPSEILLERIDKFILGEEDIDEIEKYIDEALQSGKYEK